MRSHSLLTSLLGSSRECWAGPLCSTREAVMSVVVEGGDGGGDRGKGRRGAWGRRDTGRKAKGVIGDLTLGPTSKNRVPGPCLPPERLGRRCSSC